MGHYNYNHHEDLLGDLVSSESDSSSDEEEDVWNPLMDFQEGEPVRDLNILMLPKVEQEEDGTVSVTISDTFERFYPMIYIAPFAGHEIAINETADQLRLIFPENISGLRAVEVTGNINGTMVVERAEQGSCLASVSTSVTHLSVDPTEAILFTYTIKYRN